MKKEETVWKGKVEGGRLQGALGSGIIKEWLLYIWVWRWRLMQVPWEELGIGRQVFCKSLFWKEYFRPESLKWEYIHNVHICHFIAYKLRHKAGAKPNLKLPNSGTIHNFSHSCVLCLAIWINWFKTLFKYSGWIPVILPLPFWEKELSMFPVVLSPGLSPVLCYVFPTR